MDRVEQMKKFFALDRFVAGAGVEIVEIDETHATVRAKIEDRHLNADGVVQGGMLYTAADFAFAVLANFLHPVTVTQCGSITYLAAAVTDEITATATETARNGHNTVSEVIVKDGAGKTVCICHFNGFIKVNKN